MLTAPPVIYPLSLHDALPIFDPSVAVIVIPNPPSPTWLRWLLDASRIDLVPDGPAATMKRTSEPPHYNGRSEEHTSELQSRPHLVCRLLLEKKKKKSK